MAAPWDTAGNVINQAAVEVGLAAVSDPYASTDQNFMQLCGFLKSLGRDLWREKRWSHLTKETTFVTVANQADYDLPDDFGYFINQSAWNRTTRFPLGGPLSPQEWQYLKARLANVVFRVLFRPQNYKLKIYPDTSTPGDYTIAYEYVSRWWVSPTGGTSPTTDQPTASTDIIYFDPQLLMRGLKLYFLQAKGFDTEAVKADYDLTLAQVSGDDGFAPVLGLSRRTQYEPLIDANNVPITGFGS